MRKVLLLSVCGLVFNVVVLAALYVPGASYPGAVFWLPFLPAFLTFGSALLVINGGRLGRLRWDRLGGALVMLPRWAQAGLGLLLPATMALTWWAGTRTDAGSERAFAAGAVWIAAVGTALHYGVQRGRTPGVSPRPITGVDKVIRLVRGSKAAGWWYRIPSAVLAVAAAGLAIAWFLVAGEPIDENPGTHEKLAAQFDGASWYQHLVAANTGHAALGVYLDTGDAAVQAEVCRDLGPMASGLGLDRGVALYRATGGHARFVRTC
ncbi:hypothetical protein ODJ79_32460 [Actinoplanes sp. KI2]|uniref:hypothetical protein n=1 Tax=Actinoplanes sp. KI2 TaxID=2983315 RepID=UPI0021D5B1EB|nr:hypothetical protein [Actinoplanes sp. KI2]MCU7728448.1 hypothetical protein [Actinoplanes sp. KI2]